MTPRALRSTLTKVAAALATATSAIILGSCGGGGGAGASFTGGPLTLSPDVGTFYAGVPYTFTVAGGVVPYLVSSSEPELFPLPPTELAGHSFTVTPNQPGVIDAGLTAGELQGRTVVIQIRDKNGAIFRTPSSNGIFVARNFLTGYGVQFVSSCSAPAGGGAAPSACAGGDSFVGFGAVINGNLFKHRSYRLERLSGEFGFVACDSRVLSAIGPVPTSTTPTTNTITCPTDDAGSLVVRFRVTVGIATQLASFRVVDVLTGVSTTEIFTIASEPPASALEIIPNDIILTGPAQSIQCGRGPAGAVIFNGEPPYTATSSNSNFTAGFVGNTLSITGSGACEEGTIVVVDSRGRRGTVTVSGEASSVAPVALTISPTTVDLNGTCGFSSSVMFIGGTGTINTLSNHPRVTAGASGSTITVTRATTDPPSPPGPAAYPTTATITVTDGTTITSIGVTNVNPFCP